MDSTVKNTYVQILKEALVPAAGCTEPLTVAYAAAKAHAVLGMQPTAVTASVSENIQKHVKNVTIPKTNGLKGMQAAIAAGILFGDAEAETPAWKEATPENSAAILRLKESLPMDIACAETECPIYISITLYARTSYARVVIANRYSNIVEIMKNGELLLSKPLFEPNSERQTDPACFAFQNICAFAKEVPLSEVSDLLERQIDNNLSVCENGLKGETGSVVGRIYEESDRDHLLTRIKAYAAAANDARLNGHEGQIITLLGSILQSIVTTVPIVLYARAHGISEELIKRAVLLSDLLLICRREQTGKISGCSTLHAGGALAAGIALLEGADETAIEQAYRKARELLFETTCDGTAASCAIKAAAAIDIGFLGARAATR